MKTKKFKLGPKQRKWIRELRSKKYKQCKGELHNDKTGGYCCLGVANVCLKLGEIDSICLETEYKSLGLNGTDGQIIDGYSFPRGNRNYTQLTEMNDKGVSFLKIAEFIEQNPEKVFNKSV